MEVRKIRNQNTTNSKAKIIIPVLLLTLALVMAISINDVSASEVEALDNPTNAVYVDNQLGNDDNDGSAASPFQSIGGGVAAVSDNVSVIKVRDGTYTGINNTKITIDRNMTIKGGFQFENNEDPRYIEPTEDQRSTIDGENNNWIFNITGEATVTLENLIFTNAFRTAFRTADEGGYGGAIFNQGTLTIKNCQFIDNKALRGGAIYNTAQVNAEATVNIWESYFRENETVKNGGAIYNSGSLTVKENTFTDNKANGDGGAIYNAGYLTVTENTFTSNTANWAGGAIYNDGSLTVKENSTFCTNTADIFGGAILNDGSLTISDCTFTSNAARNKGGAIYNAGSLTVKENSTFCTNTATYGGAIYNHRGTLNFNGSTFTSNTAIRGGAIDNYDGTLNVKGSTFTDNKATGDGGAIYNAGYLTVTESTFEDNSADKGRGGAIYSYGDLTVTESTFTSNTARDGGAIYNYDGSLTISDCTFTSNTATFGGAILNAGSLTISDCTFTSNTAADSGGAIYSYGDLTVTESTFTSNTAIRGGAIYNHDGSLTVKENSTFCTNTARYGGAIRNSGDLTVTESTFKGNTATFGGAIYNAGSLTVKENTIFRTNTAIVGGAIDNFTDNKATNNLLSGDDGAIYSYGDLTVTESTFKGNTAIRGGAIYMRSSANIDFSRFFENTATYGNTIHIYHSGSVNAKYNWWGSNHPNFTSLIYGTVDYSPWLYMTINADPDSILFGEQSTITVSFNNLSDESEFPENGHIPDGTPVKFETNLGSIGSKTVDLETEDGIASATLNANKIGLAQVKAVTDSQILNRTVNIDPIITMPVETGIYTRAEIEDAAIRVRNFITNRGRLPNWVLMTDTAGVEHQVTMPVFLELSTATLIYPVAEFSALEVDPANQPVGPRINQSLSQTGYMDVATRVNAFIRTNNRAPNFASSAVGNIRYQALVDAFARVVAFRAERGRMPRFVTINTARLGF